MLSRARNWWLRLKARLSARAVVPDFDKASFDKEWYLLTYPDVAHSGLDPLLHYLAYGRREGRLPRLDAKPVLLSRSPCRRPVDRYAEQLWGGFSHWAYPRLARLAEKNKGRAAWHLALWDYVQGHVASASHWLESAQAPGGQAQWLRALAKCYSLSDDRSNLRRHCPEARSRELTDVDKALIQSNSALKPEGQLEPVNGLYHSESLMEICRSNPDQPLALDNLSGNEARHGVRPGISAGVSGVKVSVVVCAYNAAATLSTALDSLLAQSGPALEVIVVDDASNDTTQSVIQAYQARDKRIRGLRNASNLGAYASRNRGARAATGDYITVHDSDDWSHPQKLALQLEPLLDDPRLVASVSRWVRVAEPFRFVGSWQLNQGFLEVNPSSWLVRRDVFEQIGFWDEVKVEADTEFAKRLEHHYGRSALAHVLPNVPLAFARTGGETLTGSSATHVSTQFYGLRRLYGEASRWWHRASAGKPVMSEKSNGSRPFPVPLGSFPQAVSGLEQVWVANFAVEGRKLEQLLAFLEATPLPAGGVCLLHWPDPRGWQGNVIADEVFAWCQANHVHWAHPGLSLDVHRLVLLQPLGWCMRPTSTVCLPRLAQVVDHEGRPAEPQEDWLGYFQAGGVSP